MPSRADKADIRRARLLDVSRKLFIENGFHGTGVAQIAAESGVRVGQIYRDFASKEDIVAALVEADLAEFLAKDLLAESVRNGDTAAVREWIGRFTRCDEPIEECRMMTEIVAEGARNVRIADIHRNLDAQVRDSLMIALEVLVPGPAAAARRVLLVDMILTVGLGMVNRRIVDPDLDCRALSDRMERFVDDELGELRTLG
ncbi:TetR/AcrR family transcriptional regulator [Sphingomonas sp. Leaf343]|uniref:TetR/AcrR family transcriptional regulator n=1 Tax=Sphingomonas sp. Leaf343 TaxID=1736345 RepID=UPI0006F7D47B|nr:TetR/AcrR family transcriptional regulator [Sphingomonas sp. Leaf343]